jgi:hypothetical protein
MPATSPKKSRTTSKKKPPEEAAEKRPSAALHAPFVTRHARMTCNESAARETAMPIMSMPESRSEYCR